jgi:hypothetical protein
MNRCELCGNEYDQTIEIVREGKAHIFDSFECAIQVMAPACPHCGCKIVGHGVQSDGTIYCCAHCAREMGEKALKDRK